jgi:hypothetical protein
VTTAKVIRRQGSARGQGWLVAADIGWSFTADRGRAGARSLMVAACGGIYGS